MWTLSLPSFKNIVFIPPKRLRSDNYLFFDILIVSHSTKLFFYNQWAKELGILLNRLQNWEDRKEFEASFNCRKERTRTGVFFWRSFFSYHDCERSFFFLTQLDGLCFVLLAFSFFFWSYVGKVISVLFFCSFFYFSVLIFSPICQLVKG